VTDRKQRRLELLSRLRGMHVEQARADHVAAQAELEEKRARAENTQRRIEALDLWAGEQLSGGTALPPELLRQAQLYRGVEKVSLDEQRAEQEKCRERTEAARGELAQKFEDLSVVERLAVRHQQFVMHEQLRHGYVELDEAGVHSKLEAKE